MSEPKSALAQRTRTYAGTMAQYNRLLRRFSELNDEGKYDATARKREEIVEKLMNRYADNIVNSEPYLRTLQGELNRGVAEGRDNRANRDAAWAAADNVAIPRRIYNRKNR